MDSKLEQAKEWARDNIDDFYEGQRVYAACEVILSLPDQWVGAEKVAELADDMANWSFPGMPSTAESDCRHLIELLGGFADRINDLLTPPLPTLADLIEAGNDPQQYQWMQCTVEGGDDTFVIASVRELVTKVLLPDGMHEVKGNSQVTPLPDLPKLEWPGSVPETAPGEERKENA